MALKSHRKQTVSFRGKGIEAYQLDIDEEKFPFDNDSFDMVYCGEIIEHLFNPDHLLDEVHRILKPGGKCIITTPNLAGWPNRLSLLLGYQPFATSVSPEHEGAGKLMLKGNEGQWGHIRVFTTRALKELLKIHSFKIICPLQDVRFRLILHHQDFLWAALKR